MGWIVVKRTVLSRFRAKITFEMFPTNYIFIQIHISIFVPNLKYVSASYQCGVKVDRYQPQHPKI